MIPAARSSSRRSKGTVELKSKSVDHVEFFNGQRKSGGIIDQIITNMTPEDFTYIQMDNATPHRGYYQEYGENTDETLNEYCRNNNYKMKYITQPAQSPDFNINDLAIFNSLQKQSWRLKEEGNRSLEGLLDAVQRAWDKYLKESISIAYDHKFACYNQCLKHDGDNRYKSSHAQVRKKFLKGELLNQADIYYNEYLHLRQKMQAYFGY